MKRSMFIAALAAFVLAGRVTLVRTAVDDAATGVVFKTSAQLMAVLAERAKAAPAPEMMAANVKSGDHYMINVVRRTKPQGAIAHDVGTEVHSVIDGSATLVTGGTMVRPANGDRGGGTIQNGESRRVAKGDMVMVPPQTPHWYQQIDGVVTYLEIRFDVGAPPGGPAAAITAADIKTVLAGKGAAVPAPLMFSAPIGRGEKFQANVVKRTLPQGGGAHELGTEVHHILEGSGTLVTGGRVVRSGTNGQGTIEGGDAHQVAPGDVVLIPANTPHWYKDVNGSIRYLEVRFELPKP